ncbi:MAG: hypothetical protein HY308_02430 [Gammaproteobacteria bacterium]|nr:hypothetical protein [Gammaproteobacteria bacterium]
MKTTIARSLAAVLLTITFSSAMAADGGFDPQQVFFGVGASLNEVDNSDTGFGYQFFGGYKFGAIANNINFDVEAGYMDTGEMEVEECVNAVGIDICAKADARAKGLWSAGVFHFVMSPQTEILGRVGFDFGDDDGLMFGAGVGFNLNPQTQLRVELVERDNVESLQLNLAFHL